MLLADVIAMLPSCLQLVFFVLAGVIAMLLYCLWQMVMLLPSGSCSSLCLYWQMLLPFVFVTVGIATFDISCTKRCTTVIVFISLADVMAKMADVIAMWLMFLPLFCSFVLFGRCYCLVVDGMPTMGVDGRCYSQCGRWIGHWVSVSAVVLMFCVGLHPIYEAAGTCLCFCLGMGH